MGQALAIIVVWNLLFIGSFRLDMDATHLIVLFEHPCHVHCLDMNVICLFILFNDECCVSICIVYIRKSCTQFPCLNNAWHSCVKDTNLWNNKFRMDFKRTHDAYKFVMCVLWYTIKNDQDHWPSMLISYFHEFKNYLTTLELNFFFNNLIHFFLFGYIKLDAW